MQNLSLILHYNSLFDAGQFDDLYDVLAIDFYFRNPLIEIHGRDDFVTYAKENFTTFETETIKLEKFSENEYVHEYILNFLFSAPKHQDKLHITEYIKVKNFQIVSSVYSYKTDGLSDEVMKIIKQAAMGYGTLLDKK